MTQDANALPEPSAALRAARRSLDGLAGIQDISPWQHLTSLTKRWAIRFVVDTGLEATDFVPNPSAWYATVDDNYPLGSIHIYPDAEGSITATFPHMTRNGPPIGKLPFRTGNLCVTNPDAVFARFSSGTEPYEEHTRLEWHVGRTVEWVKAAANDELLRAGDPYELPVFPCTDSGTKRKKWVRVAVQENTERLAEWGERNEIWGLVPVHPIAGRQDLWATGNFEDGAGHTVMSTFWGHTVDRHRCTRWAAWLRLPAPPVMAPWAAPQTWGELAHVCHHQGVDCDTFIAFLARWAQRKTIHYILVGFPIPDLVGDEPVQLAWKAIRLDPPLSRKMSVMPGFRTGPQQLRMQVQRILTGRNPLNWQPTENWEAQVLNARGAFNRSLRMARILAIGGGAVGSKITETLTRGGCEIMTLVDPDVLAAGNLRRHTLLLSNVDHEKAGALSNRLNQISPYMSAVAFPAALPPAGEGLARLMRNTDLVLDMTAEDQVLLALSGYADGDPQTFISISTGYEARRLFFFAYQGNNFPLEDFQYAMAPWLERETVERKAQGATMGIPDAPGCWHPLFPARDDNLQILAGAAVRMIERFYASEIVAGLHVLEIRDDPGTLLPTLTVATL